MSAREQKRTAAFIYERRTFMINKHMNTEKQQLYGIWLLQNVLRKTDG